MLLVNELEILFINYVMFDFERVSLKLAETFTGNVVWLIALPYLFHTSSKPNMLTDGSCYNFMSSILFAFIFLAMLMPESHSHSSYIWIARRSYLYAFSIFSPILCYYVFSDFEKYTVWLSSRMVIGYDEGTIMIKMGREVPVASMDTSGKIIWAKHNEIQTVNIKTVGAGFEVSWSLSL